MLLGMNQMQLVSFVFGETNLNHLKFQSYGCRAAFPVSSDQAKEGSKGKIVRERSSQKPIFWSRGICTSLGADMACVSREISLE